MIADQYRRLMRAGLVGDMEAVEQVAEEIGFIVADTQPDHRARIIRMIGIVFESLRSPEPYDFAQTEMSQQMQAEGMVLAEEGFVPPPLPIDVLLTQRKFGGVFLLAARLRAKVDVRGLMERALG